MPKRRGNSGDGNFSISFKTLGAVGTALTIIGLLVGGMLNIATKQDVKDLATTYNNNYSNIDNRVRNLEIQMASFFGRNSPASMPIKPSSDEAPLHVTGRLLRVQAQEGVASTPTTTIPRTVTFTRRVVVTDDFIKDHDLTPSQGGSYAVLGEDGKFYAMDDILATLVKEHEENFHPREEKVQEKEKVYERRKSAPKEK